MTSAIASTVTLPAPATSQAHPSLWWIYLIETKSEFLKQGNAICKAGNQKINQAFNQIQGSPTQAQAEQVVTTTVIPSIQGQIDDIRNLGIPSGDETQVNKILNDAQSALDQVKKDPSLITQNGADPFAQANKEASAYGLTVCGSG